MKSTQHGHTCALTGGVDDDGVTLTNNGRTAGLPLHLQLQLIQHVRQ